MILIGLCGRGKCAKRVYDLFTVQLQVAKIEAILQKVVPILQKVVQACS
jgi:hypothetical protein